MSDIKLKPCPFCGGHRVVLLRFNYGRNYAAKCMECGAFGESGISKIQAVTQWNTRKSMERIVEQLEKCKAFSVSPQFSKGIDRAIEIVKKGGTE